MINVPTPSKGWCLNPKGLLNGNPLPSILAPPWRVQVVIDNWCNTHGFLCVAKVSWGVDTTKLLGGFNPFEKYYSNWIISPNRGENKTCLKPQPRKILENLGATGKTLFYLVSQMWTNLCWWMGMFFPSWKNKQPISDSPGNNTNGYRIKRTKPLKWGPIYSHLQNWYNLV